MGHDDLQFGRAAVRLGFIEPKQLASCLQMQKEMLDQGQPLHISQILLKQGLLTTLQVDAIMKVSVKDISLDKTNLRPPTEQMGAAKTLAKKDKTDKIVSSLGRYQILEEIGRGGMGRVYKAQDTRLDRIVAIKKLIADDDKESVARFLREAKATAKLDHPNIVKVYELGEEADQYYFVMDYVEGVSLQALAQKLTLTIRQIAEIMVKIANAVQYAHDQGIIHRDLKPGNVMITGDNEPKIMDFGLAKVSGENSKLSQSGVVLGTLQYMPPEQAEGRLRAIDKTSDVYSLGAIMYELLTGKPPFTGTSFSHVLDQVLHREPVPPTQLKLRIPKPMEAICLKALQKDKSKRYPGARDLAADLTSFLRGKKIKGVAGTAREKVRKVLKVYLKKYQVIIAVCAAVLVLAMLLVFASGRAAKKDPAKSPKIKVVKDKEPPGTPTPPPIEPQPPKDVLTMTAKMVDGNKVEKLLYTTDETIQVEVAWDLAKVPDDAALEVKAYGEKIKTLVSPVAKDTRKFYCPLTLLDDATGNVEVTVQLRVGQTSVERKLGFTVEKKTASFIPTIVNENRVPQSHFAVGEKIFLEADWTGKAIASEAKVYVVLSGDGIQPHKYVLPSENRTLRFAIELTGEKKTHYELLIELISGPNRLEKKLPFTVGDKAGQSDVAFEILVVQVQDKDGKPRTKFKWNEPVEIMIQWKVTSAPPGTPQEVKITGNGVQPNAFPQQKTTASGETFTFTIILNATEQLRSKTLEVVLQVVVGNVTRERTTLVQIE